MGMGNPFLFFILLFVSSSLAITEEQEKFLKEVNEAREKYANEYNVPSMHKLIWSEELLKILKTLNFKGNWPHARITWRYTDLDSYDGVTKLIDDEMNTFLSNTDKKGALKAGTLHRLELLNPIQTVISCEVIPNGAETKLVCLVGPEGQGNLWDVDNKPSEPAGSHCPKRYQNENGLCVPKDPSKISCFGYQDDFIAEVNELRREYAKQYNVPNMHRLVWNEELTKTAELLDYSQEWPYARRTWRFGYFESYLKQTDLIKEKLDAFIKKSAEERKAELIEVNKSHMGTLEVLNPRQSEIGCAPLWTDPHTIEIVCLVGTRGQVELWDFDSKSTEEPGSACPVNYKNEDGLCIPNDSTPVSIYGNREVFMKELNEARRKYANEYNVPNMHQLVWSEDLVKTVEPLDLNSVGSFARKTWRFSRVWSYRNIIEDLEEIMGRFLEKNAADRVAWVADKNSNNADLIELLNPLQTVVGCAEKTDTVTVLVCLVGTEGSFTLWDFTKKSTATPGSKCQKGYENTNGLCTIVLPTPPPPRAQRVTQRIPGADAQQSDKGEPDTATTGFSPYLMISFSSILFLY